MNATQTEPKAIRRECPGCGQSIEMPESMIGSLVQCPTCGRGFFPSKPRAASPEPVSDEMFTATFVTILVILFGGALWAATYSLDPSGGAFGRVMIALAALCVCLRYSRLAIMVIGFIILVGSAAMGSLMNLEAGGFIAVIGAVLMVADALRRK